MGADFQTELAISASITMLCFLLISGGIIISQRRKRRRSVHWFAVFLLSSLVGLFSGMGLHLSGEAFSDVEAPTSISEG